MPRRHNDLYAAILGAISFASLSASAQDIPGTPMAAEAASQEPAATEKAADGAWVFDVYFGSTFTSDYISHGITQTDRGPAVQPYIEPSWGPLYAGVWASNVDYLVPDPDWEIDLYFGARPEIGPVSTDFGFLHYVYPGDSGSNYSELKAAAEITPIDPLTLSAELNYAWDYSQLGDHSTYLETKAEWSLPHGFAVSGGPGFQFFGSETWLSDYMTWNIGGSYTWEDTVKFDLRYYDTDLSADSCEAEYTRRNSCDARIVATVSIDTSWTALRDWGKAE